MCVEWTIQQYYYDFDNRLCVRRVIRGNQSINRSSANETNRIGKKQK